MSYYNFICYTTSFRIRFRIWLRSHMESCCIERIQRVSICRMLRIISTASSCVMDLYMCTATRGYGCAHHYLTEQRVTSSLMAIERGGLIYTSSYVAARVNGCVHYSCVKRDGYNQFDGPVRWTHVRNFIVMQTAIINLMDLCDGPRPHFIVPWMATISLMAHVMDHVRNLYRLIDGHHCLMDL